jgi:hypothetical protein
MGRVNQIGRMSELVTKPIAGGVIGGFREELKPTLRLPSFRACASSGGIGGFREDLDPPYDIGLL